jgi:restriction-modification enzyme MmeI-like protein
VKAFHDKLCDTRVLDPACGTGNFLYVSMELMKRLEGEVLEALLDLGGQEALRGLGGHTVDPHQFLGLEINPRAAAIAELVLWIGFLQWHFRTKGGTPEQPILRRFRNIEVKNAVLTWDGYPVPQVVDRKEAYPYPKRPAWPLAEFIVGNPPFIGKGALMREAFSDAYVNALWAAHPHMNDSADFVMYWWDRAADLLTTKGTPLRRFGLVTTNSITQEFSRRVMKNRMQRHLISILMAIPDHPWTKATTDAAMVRIAMTVVGAGDLLGQLHEVIRESDLDSDEPLIEYFTQIGKINPDLTIGVDITDILQLVGNRGLSSNGMLLAGRGFVVTKSEVEHLGWGKHPDLESYIRPYVNGRELQHGWSGRYVIDFSSLESESIRRRFPSVYQHLLATVKRERDAVAARTSVKDAQDYAARWWRFAKVRRDFRLALDGLPRFIGTTETTKHRLFQFIDAAFINDHMVIGFAFDDAYVLGVLSSRIHCQWALRAGGWLGMGNDPRYSKSKIFDTFPFPATAESLKIKIRDVAEELDAFRKQRQKEHPSLTLTQMYNVLQKLKATGVGQSEDALSPEEEDIREKGLILILKELHEKIDRLVLDAYGWLEPLSDEEILEKLVALNHERAAEERRGLVRWLRPEYQIPRFGKDIDKQAAQEEGAQIAADLGLPERATRKPSFPNDGVAQTAAVFAALASASAPTDVGTIAARYRRTRNLERTISSVLASLARLGHVTTKDGKTFEFQRPA